MYINMFNINRDTGYIFLTFLVLLILEFNMTTYEYNKKIIDKYEMNTILFLISSTGRLFFYRYHYGDCVDE